MSARNDWQQVGAALGSLFGPGREARSQAVYNEQMARNAETSRKIAEARLAQLTSGAREGFFADESMPLLHRQLIAGGLGTQFQPLQAGLATQAEVAARQRAEDAARAGDWAAAQAAALNVHGRPLELNQFAAGGEINFNPYVAGGGGAITPIGQAEIERVQAAEAAQRAAADASMAMAEKRRRPAGVAAAPGMPEPVSLRDMQEFITTSQMIEAENRRRATQGRPPLPLPPDPSGLGAVFAPPAAAAPAAPVQAAPVAAPYHEGTQLIGPDGRLYIVRNGAPVLAE